MLQYQELKIPINFGGTQYSGFSRDCLAPVYLPFYPEERGLTFPSWGNTFRETLFSEISPVTTVFSLVKSCFSYHFHPSVLSLCGVWRTPRRPPRRPRRRLLLSAENDD